MQGDELVQGTAKSKKEAQQTAAIMVSYEEILIKVYDVFE